MNVILNVISTVNGMENEGMRNIASHVIHGITGKCHLRQSALGNPAECMKNSVGADAVLIFARASKKTAYLAKGLRVICKNVYFVLVQKPEPEFLRIIGKGAAKYGYFAILPKDGAELSDMGAVVYPLKVGINREKFHPATDREEIIGIRRKYGFDDDLPIVLHVGHLSAGRGLEEFLHLTKEKYHRLVVASGMFNSDEVEARLRADGVRIIKEYLPDIGEVYRMADVYLFPTRSAEFVISIPLSVTEALACGVPVVAFDGVNGIGMIKSANAESLVTVSDPTELESAVETAAKLSKGERRDLLFEMGSWESVAEELLAAVKSDLGKN